MFTIRASFYQSLLLLPFLPRVSNCLRSSEDLIFSDSFGENQEEDDPTMIGAYLVEFCLAAFCFFLVLNNAYYPLPESKEIRWYSPTGCSYWPIKPLRKGKSINYAITRFLFVYAFVQIFEGLSLVYESTPILYVFQMALMAVCNGLYMRILAVVAFEDYYVCGIFSICGWVFAIVQCIVILVMGPLFYDDLYWMAVVPHVAIYGLVMLASFVSIRQGSYEQWGNVSIVFTLLLSSLFAFSDCVIKICNMDVGYFILKLLSKVCLSVAQRMALLECFNSESGDSGSIHSVSSWVSSARSMSSYKDHDLLESLLEESNEEIRNSFGSKSARIFV